MKEEGKVSQSSNIWIALIGAVASIAVAALTTYATLASAGEKVNKLSAEAESIRTDIDQGTSPAGSIVAFAGPIDAADLKKRGWLPCDGQAVARNDFKELFAAIGTTWGRGDGVHTFNVPDLRGVFLRGVNGSRSDEFADPDASARRSHASGANTGNEVGSFQEDSVGDHKHQRPSDVWDSGARDGLLVGGGGSYGFSYRAPFPETSGLPTHETRPRNAYVHYLIRF